MENQHCNKRYGELQQPVFVPPKTPEPFANHGDIQPPSPPRQTKLRVKRRIGSNLSAPTQQFLASVAAAETRSADIPIPSIEEPDFTADDADSACSQILSVSHLPAFDEASLAPLRGRMFSPPKTPAPGMAPSLSPQRYPDWSIDSPSSRESSPEYESSRPSTARSTLTSGSLFSRISCLSDENHLASPEFESRESKQCTAQKEEHELKDDEPATKRLKRKVPWTRAMSNHLWAVYVQYLQDPTKTPVRMGKSCIPPQGVCSRVAREAKRIWRGAKMPARKAHIHEGNSRSTTPKADSSGVYMQWPHSTASTRAHLRDLCKRQAAISGVRNRHFMSKSPTPFYQPSHGDKQRPSVFNPQEMNKSLIISTAESMQPNGPLAQLAQNATPEPMPAPQANPSTPLKSANADSLAPPAPAEPPRLASPFGAKSYGPSSSGSLSAAGNTSSSTAQRHTVGGRRNTLQSPVRLSRPSGHRRSKTKQLSLDARRRPLPADIFQDPLPSPRVTSDKTSATLGLDDPFSPRSAEIASTIRSSRRARGHTVWAAPATAGLAPPVEPLPRLGSPFTASTNSHSVPNRFSLPNGMSADVLLRPFATLQEYGDAHAPQPRNLANRLAYIDQRLREFNSRENLRVCGTSESPL